MSVYSRNLAGQNLKIVVGTATYTAQTTIAAFLTSAAEGEVGIFLDDGTRKTTALTAGQKFQVVQKRDSGLNKSPILAFDDIFRKVRTAYTAPVKKIMTIGYDGTSNDLGFDFTGASFTNTLTVGIVARDLTPGNQPFPVQEGYATVNSTATDEYATLATIIKQLNADRDYERVMPDRFVKAEILSDGTLTALGQTAAVINGSVSVTAGAAVTLADKSFLSLAGVIYQVNGTVTASTAIIIDRPFQGTTATLASAATSVGAATMAYTSGTNNLGVRLTALSTDNIFTANGFGPGVQNAAVATATAWVLGAGAGAQIALLESTEGILFDGVGSTLNAPFKADYGQPSLFASSALTYDQIFVDLKPLNIPSANLPFYEQRQIERVLIACPVGGTLNSTLQTVFGV